MINSYESALLSALDHQRIWDDTASLAQFDRRSGREGEANAVDLLTSRLDRAGVSWKLHRYPVWLSDPVRASLKVLEAYGTDRPIFCKTWSFCGNSGGPRQGKTVFLENSCLEHNPLALLLSRGNMRERDLEGKVVIARTSSPTAVMDAEDRGAAAMICVWPQGDETLIHEGNVNLIWGQPEPWETSFYPTIPVVILSRGEGEKLIERAKNGVLSVELETELENCRREIPILEADIPGESEDYVLLGNHLDSWFYGACDNATGNAIALNMAELFSGRKQPRSLKICWWSGHSNGRYAGSSAFAAHNYDSLTRHCLALCNSDMPGLQGATDFARGSSGPDLEPIYASVIADTTGQTLRSGGFITGWDLSFKNIGVSSCMSWTSTLPDNSPYGTANSFMSWWWHTEADLLEHLDRDILKQDAQIYALTLARLLHPAEFPFDNSAIAKTLSKNLSRFDDAAELATSLKKMRFGCKNALTVCRLLNRALYTFKGPAAQDWAISLDLVPGLSLAEKVHPTNERSKLALEAFRIAQLNRLRELLRQLESFAE